MLLAAATEMGHFSLNAANTLCRGWWHSMLSPRLDGSSPLSFTFISPGPCKGGHILSLTRPSARTTLAPTPMTGQFSPLLPRSLVSSFLNVRRLSG